MGRVRRTAVILLLLLAGCGDEDAGGFTGYMEARLVLVGPEAGGRIEELAVAEGDRVEAGRLLFRLEEDRQRAALAQAEAQLTEARARLADARAHVQRPAEVAVLQAARVRAAADLELARKELERSQYLFAQGATSQARLDLAHADHERGRAALAEAERRVEAAEQPGRSGQIEAAEAAVREAEARLAERRLALEERRVATPVAGSVEDVYFRVGEVVAAGQPVLALLPPDGLFVRFFVPEPLRARVAPGDTVLVACDGCPPGMRAQVAFVAREAEFTPPVILSREQRHRLVYLVEARPVDGTERLTAGQPVSVRLP